MDFLCLPPSGDDDDPLKLCTVHFPLQIRWPPHVRHVKQRGSIFSNPGAFSAYAEACSTIALLSQILGNSVVVSSGGRVEHLRLAMLMRIADDANDDRRQHINDLLKLLLADDLMQHGFGYPPQSRIDGNDRRVFALRIDVLEVVSAVLTILDMRRGEVESSIRGLERVHQLESLVHGFGNSRPQLIKHVRWVQRQSLHTDAVHARGTT